MLDVLRTLLFVPGNNERMLLRAPASGADAIVVDLEDAVPAAEKRAARKLTRSSLAALVAGGRPVLVRVNNVGGRLTRDDVMAIVRPGLAGVVHPKTESAQDLRDLDVLLREAEMANKVRPGDIRVIPLIETPLGALRCEEIALGSDRVDALSVGGEDYSAALGVERDAGGAALMHVRSIVVTVAAAYGLFAIDTPYANFKDAKGLTAEAELAQALGFKGKYVIHPDQVAPVNDIFTPSAAAVDDARRMVAAAEAAARGRRGAISVDGRMVDAPVVERARRLLALAEALAARTPQRQPRAGAAKPRKRR